MPERCYCKHYIIIFTFTRSGVLQTHKKGGGDQPVHPSTNQPTHMIHLNAFVDRGRNTGGGGDRSVRREGAKIRPTLTGAIRAYIAQATSHTHSAGAIPRDQFIIRLRRARVNSIFFSFTIS